MQIFDIDAVESKLGYSFKDKMLLRQCFTHKSYAYENGCSDNELLEFFGDSIIEFVVTEHLYKTTAGDEGDLTKKRASLVSKDPLLKCVKLMDITQFVLLGRGQKKSVNKDEKLYSSVYEALVAGIYLDGGIVSAKKFIKNTLFPLLETQKNKQGKNKETQKNDYKSRFQEHVQKHKIGSIAYELLWKKGPDHKPEFRVAATLNGTKIAEGSGSSKRQAESNAAKVALEKLLQGGKD